MSSIMSIVSSYELVLAVVEEYTITFKLISSTESILILNVYQLTGLRLPVQHQTLLEMS